MQLKTLAHHQETNVKSVPKQWPPPQPMPSFNTEHDVKRYEISLESAGSLFQLCPLTSCVLQDYSVVGWCEKQKRS